MARKIIIILTILIIVPTLMLVGFAFLSGSSTPEPPMPKPNGYEDLIRIAQTISQQSNAMTANLVRQALTNKCRMPIEYSESFSSNSLNQLVAFKSIERLLMDQGKAAEDSGKTNQALQWYLDGMRFGQAIQTGGLMITRLVGIACDAIALQSLTTLESKLDAANCRAMAKSLEEIDAAEETIQECLETETRWSKRTFGFKGQLTRLVMYKQEKQSVTNFVSRDNRRALQRRQLIITAAARAYLLEKGKDPAKAGDLVPEYLQVLPKDPVSGQALTM